MIARRDLTSLLFSRSFVFFLLAPVLPILVAVGYQSFGQDEPPSEPQVIGLAMSELDNLSMIYARHRLINRMAGPVPRLIIVHHARAGVPFDPVKELRNATAPVAGYLTGTLVAPNLIAPPDRAKALSGMISAIAAKAKAPAELQFPVVTLTPVEDIAAHSEEGRLATGQAGQLLLFLLTMMLAGLVLSNLIEEKGNKIIEVLASAIPIEALFFGKILGALAISVIGAAVWLLFGGVALAAVDGWLIAPEPAVGWPMFLTLGLIYFAMAYLLLGSVFLSVGAFATTAREVQTLSLPATIFQVFVFFIASFVLSKGGRPFEPLAIIFPFSSPYTMIARAAQTASLWPHALALVWQGLWVGAVISVGAQLFRRNVMKSGPAPDRPRARWWPFAS